MLSFNRGRLLAQPFVSKDVYTSDMKSWVAKRPRLIYILTVAGRRIIVGLSGATGVIYGIRILEVLSKLPNIETHLIISEPAKRNIVLESNWKVTQVEALASYVYNNDDIEAALSGGSFKTDGMVVCPCSIKSMSSIAMSYNDNLLVRAADVILKEKRKLVLVVRETPLHSGHLRSMAELSERGAVILPPMPAFYHHPKTIDDVINQTVGKILDQFDIEHQLFERWKGAGLTTSA